jgi:hypothetical protein
VCAQNNAQLTMIDNDFENNGYPSLDIRSVIAARIIGTGIAQTVWKLFPSTGGIIVGNSGITNPKWQVTYLCPALIVLSCTHTWPVVKFDRR